MKSQKILLALLPLLGGTLVLLTIVIHQGFTELAVGEVNPVSYSVIEKSHAQPAATPSSESVQSSTDGVTVTSNVSEQNSTNSLALATPVFYSLHTNNLEKLGVDQQYAVIQLQKEYVEFFNAWNQKYPKDQAAWNSKMDEYRQRLVSQIGAEAADEILR